METDHKAANEAGTPENLGLKKPDVPAKPEAEAEHVEDKGEPFGENFA